MYRRFVTRMGRLGKHWPAPSFANPIRRSLDYQAIGRRALIVEPLPQGSLPIYDKDISVAKTVIGNIDEKK